jgi:hypothetical protein
VLDAVTTADQAAGEPIGERNPPSAEEHTPEVELEFPNFESIEQEMASSEREGDGGASPRPIASVVKHGVLVRRGEIRGVAEIEAYR